MEAKLILLLQIISLNWVKEVVGPLSDCDESSCFNGNCKNGVCECSSCFEGPQCQIMKNVAPIFQRSSYEFLLVQTPRIGDILGQVAADDRDKDQCVEATCPCSAVKYSIVNDGNNGLFKLNPLTGELLLGKDEVNQDYEYSIDVQATNESPFDNVYDTATVYVRFSRMNVNVSERLGRVKRAASAPAVLSFLLTQTYPVTALTTMQIGQRITFQLTITFPVGLSSLTVELFAPEATSPVMMLCNANVVSMGNQISAQPFPAPVNEGILGGPIWPYTKMTYAITNQNNPTASPTNLADIQAVIQFDTYMLYYPSTPTATLYYVSSGAEYLNATQIWVGQSGYTTAITAPTPTPTITITGDANISPASTAAFNVTIYAPGSYLQLNVEFYAPMNDTTVLSFCYVNRYSMGASYSCVPPTYQQPYLTSFVSNLVTYYPIAFMNLGYITNQLILDSTQTGTDKDTIMIMMTLRTNPMAWPGATQYVGVSANVTATNIVAAIKSLPVVVKQPKTPYTTPISVSLLNVNGSTAIIGSVSQIQISITVPKNTELDYTILATFQSNTSEICGFQFVSAGANVPCLNQVVLTPTFTASPDNYQVISTLVIPNIRSVNISTTASDDVINYIVSFRPINDARNNPGNTIQGLITVSWNGGTSGPQATTFTLQAANVAQNITSQNVPTFQFNLINNNGNVSVLDTRTVFFSMQLVPGIVYTPATLEFYMPFNLTARMKICQATITFVGANVICFSQNLMTSKFVYSSRINDTANYDKLSISIGSLCSAGPIGRTATNDDSIFIQIDIIVLSHSLNLVNTQTTINAGMLLTSNQIWVGNQNINFVAAPALAALVAPNIPSLTVGRVDSATNIVWNNDLAIFQYIIKVPAGATAALTLAVTTDITAADNFGVCNMTVIMKGNSIPCVVTVPTATTWSTYSKFNKQFSLQFSTIINTGTYISVNPSFDANSILVEVPVKFGPNLPTTFNVMATLTYNTGSISLNSPLTLQTTFSRVNGTITANEPIYTLNVMQLLSNFTPDVPVLGYGEALRAVLSVQLQPSSLQTITVIFASIPYSMNQMDITSVNVLSVGANIPCIKPGIMNYYTTSRSNSLSWDYCTLNLGTVCRRDILGTSSAADNTIVFEAVFRIWRIPAGVFTTADVNCIVLLNNDEIIISKITFNVAPSTTQVNETNLLNSSVSFSAALSTTVLPVGKNVTLNVSINLPPYCQFSYGAIRVYPVWLASYDSALIVSETTNFTSTFGSNVLFNPKEPLKMASTSSMNTSQLDNIVAMFGITQNPGTTYRMGQAAYNGSNINDNIMMQFNIRLSDHPATVNGFAFSIVVGAEFGLLGSIQRLNQTIPVTVSRTNSESLNIIVNTTLLTTNNVYTSSNPVQVSVSANLMNGSQLECRNFTIYVASPSFMTLTATQNISYSCPGFSVQQSNLGLGGFSFNVPYFFMNEQISAIFSMTMTANTALTRQRYQALTVIPVIYGCKTLNWPTNPQGNKYVNNVTDVRVTLQGNPVVIPGCSTDLQVTNNAVIKDCSISAYMAPFPGFDALKVRSNSLAMWKPHIRGGYYDKFRYIDIVFETLQTVVTIKVTSTAPNLPQQIAVYGTMDGRTYSYYTTANLLFSGAIAMVTLSSPSFNYYGIRISVTKTMVNDTETGLNIDLIGCTPNVTTPAIAINPCAPSYTKPVTTITDFYRRGYLYVAPNLFVCDDIPLKSAYLETYPRCYRTLDSTPTAWTDMGPYVGKVVGYDAATKSVYAIAADLKSFVMSTDDGLTYSSINENGWKVTKALGQLPSAIEVPWITSAGFNANLNGTGCTQFVAGSWNFCYDGVYNAGTKQLSWNTCCTL